MYRVEIEISEWLEAIEVSLNEASIVRFYDEDSIRERYKVEGNIVFFGNTYKMLLNEKENGALRLRVRIFIGDKQIYIGQLQLQGEWKYRSKECKLSVEIDDKYSLLLSDIDREFSFRQFEKTAKVWALTDYGQQIQSAGSAFDDVFDDEEAKYCGEDLEPGDFRPYDPDRIYRVIRSIGSEGGHTFYSGSFDDSYCRLATDIWVALKAGRLAEPSLTSGQTDWKNVHGRDIFGVKYPIMNFRQSLIKFNNAVLSEYIGLWVLPTCLNDDYWMWDFEAMNLRTMLETSLEQVDSSITLGAWDFGRLYVFNNRPETFKLKLSEIIDIYKTLFKVDWRLEGNEFWFRDEFDIIVEPADYMTNPNQYINKIYSKDWSAEGFNYSIQSRVKRFAIEVGNLADYSDFLKTVINYSTYYTDENKIENKTFELDIAALTRTETDGIAVIELNDNDFVKSYVGLEGIITYNKALSLYDLVQKYYYRGRAFSSGELSVLGYYFKKNILLTDAWNEVCQIDIPMADPTLIDFDLLIVTSFGNLQVKELSLNLNTAKALITAAK